MNRKQLALMFICSLVVWSVGYGLLPLLPVYAAQMGANSALAGYYLAIAYFAITLGSLSAGWVSDRLHRRKLPMIMAGSINIPVTWLIGHVHTLWALVAFTALLWFMGGLMLALVSILAGLSAGENERGKIFGILALTMGLGALIGGMGVGWLVDRWGYTSMFTILAVFTLVFPLSALLLEDKDVKQPKVENFTEKKPAGLGKSFYLLFSAALFSSITGFFVILIRSIAMNTLKFGPLAIASTGAVGGLLDMPSPLLMGWLSDRIGRKALIIIAYLAGLAALVMLAFSKALWNFWVVFALVGISTGSAGVANAWVTDLVPRAALGRGLAVYGASGWIGGVVGFAVAGTLIQNLGFGSAFIIGGCLALAAVGILIPIRSGSRETRQPAV